MNAVAVNRAAALPSSGLRPKLGEWYWVKDADRDESWKDEGAQKGWHLACVFKLYSNHVEFQVSAAHGGSRVFQVRYRELLERARPEPEWRKLVDARIEQKKAELAEAVRRLAEKLAALRETTTNKET